MLVVSVETKRNERVIVLSTATSAVGIPEGSFTQMRNDGGGATA
jgi:hypothetical protein